jgi:gas vesicle protein
MFVQKITIATCILVLIAGIAGGKKQKNSPNNKMLREHIYQSKDQLFNVIKTLFNDYEEAVGRELQALKTEYAQTPTPEFDEQIAQTQDHIEKFIEYMKQEHKKAQVNFERRLEKTLRALQEAPL